MFTLLLGILVIALGIVFFRKGKATHSYPPGPLCLPVIGSAYAFGSNPLRFHCTLTDLAKKWGPVYRLTIGKQPFVVLTDPDLIREAFGGTNPHVLVRAAVRPFVQLKRGRSVFFANDRALWAFLRKACTPMLKTMPGGIPLTQSISEEMVKLFVEMDKHVGKEVHLNPKFMFYVRNIFLRVLQRKSWSFDNVQEEQLKFFEALMKALALSTSAIDHFPKMDFLRSTAKEQIGKCLDITDSFIKKMLDERRDNVAESLDKARDLLDVLLLEVKNNSSLSEPDLIATLRSLFVAATGTVSDSLDWMLLFLCNHPEIQEKCFEEIDVTLKGRVPTMDDQPNLPYLDRVIKETFRLRPPAPLALMHAADRDFTLGGYHIDKGSVVVQNLYGIGNLDSFYENSSLFDPDRWLRNPEKTSNLIHFGTGPTTCLGMPIAKQEMFLTAASLLQRYKFRFGPSSPVPDFVGEYKIVYNPKVWHTEISMRHIG